jgi:group I intron endonuclease
VAILYVATNKINGKQYVGVTAKTLGYRMRKHFVAARKPTKVKFLRAISKHGEDAFDFEQVASFYSFDDALAAEVRLIEELKPQYNTTVGGRGATGLRHSPEALEKMRAAKLGKVGPWKGKKRPAETIERMRLGKLKSPTRYWLGKVRSAETVEKIRNATKGRPGPPTSELSRRVRAENMRKAAAERRRQIACLSDGNVFASIMDAAAHYGLHKASVCAVVNGHRKRVRGLVFSAVEARRGN